MCKTSSTAAGKSFGSPATTRITAAGPPVDAAITTIGTLPPVPFSVEALSEFAGKETGVWVAGSLDSVAVRTTRTFAAILSFRVNSSRTLLISKSIPLEGLGTKSIAPNSSARSVPEAPSRDSELTITIGRGCCDMINSVACRPSRCGILMSMVMTSGRSDSASATASRPSRAVPATSSCASELMISFSTLHMKAESSATSTRIFFSGAFIISILPRRYVYRRPRLRHFGANQFFDLRDQLIFLHRLGQESRSAFLHRAVSVLRSRTRSHHEHWYSSRDRILPQVRHQFVAVHARHLEVGNHQMAAKLSDNLRSL